jgi:molecular chaperone DnaK
LEDVLKTGDKVEIDTKLGALTTAQKLGEKVYADMQAQQAAAGAAGGTADADAKAKDDDVVDADFKEVKDNK